MGRLAESEGEKEIWRDLRMKLFIDPDSMKAKYESSPPWLKSLMVAWADGLNFYLAKHPDVKPKVITRFEPWMALTFSEGSIGGDIERVSLRDLEAFYGGKREEPKTISEVESSFPPEPTGSNGVAIAPSNTANKHALLLINPHTSFFFRSEVQVSSDEGLNAYGAVTWGQFFVYQGFNNRVGWMHTSSGVDNIDEYAESVVKKGDALVLSVRQGSAPLVSQKITVAYKSANGMAKKEFTIYRTQHGPVVRSADGKWISVRLMQEPVKALTQSYSRTKAKSYAEFRKVMDLAHELVEQHDLRRRGRQHRLLPLELHPEARSEVRLDEAGGRQQSGDRVGRAAFGRAEPVRSQPEEWLALQHEQLSLQRGRAG
jgi:acyl-homoserine-lactone acylase